MGVGKREVREMNKSDLVAFVAERTGHPIKKVDSAIGLLFDMMQKELVDGGRIEIRGFGSFVTRSYGSYVGRNPRTGESIEVTNKRLPYFKVGKELRERVNNGKQNGNGHS